MNYLQEVLNIALHYFSFCCFVKYYHLSYNTNVGQRTHYRYSIEPGTAYFIVMFFFLVFKAFVVLISGIYLPSQQTTMISFADRRGRGRGGARHRYCLNKSLVVKEHYQLFICVVVYVYNLSIMQSVENRLFQHLVYMVNIFFLYFELLEKLFLKAKYKLK